MGFELELCFCVCPTTHDRRRNRAAQVAVRAWSHQGGSSRSQQRLRPWLYSAGDGEQVGYQSKEPWSFFREMQTSVQARHDLTERQSLDVDGA